MIVKKIAAVSAAALMMLGTAFSGYAAGNAEEQTYSVTFTDYDGNPVLTQQVKKNQKIDYSLVDTEDTEVFRKNINKYTEVRFNSWDITPVTTDRDIEIRALFQRATIALKSSPKRTEFYSKQGKIDLDGLKVTILLETQNPQKDKNGEYIIEEEEFDISQTCSTEPKNLKNAFINNDFVTVLVFPPNSLIPIHDYKITYYGGLGDFNGDGKVNAADASQILSHYAKISTGKTDKISDEAKKASDVNRDGKINSVDSSFVLSYYAMNATGQSPQWEKLIFNNK